MRRGLLSCAAHPGAARRRVVAVGAVMLASGLAGPSAAVRAGTITVCPSGCNFPTIAAALQGAVDGDVIEIGPGSYVAGVVIGKAVTLRGAGRTVTTLTGGRSATLTLQNATGRTTLESMTVTGGIGVDIDRQRYGGGVYIKAKAATLRDLVVTANGTDRGIATTYIGGGVYIDAGDVTITDVEITHNSATTAGGGITVNLDGTLTMNGGRIADNTVRNPEQTGPDNETNARGGGLFVEERATLNGTEISGNLAVATGGGAHCSGIGKLILNNVSMHDNQAQQGAGIYNAATVTFTGGTLAHNAAVVMGGGLLNFGTATLTALSVADNTSGGKGGGLVSIKGFGSSQVGLLTLSRSTVSGNTAGAEGGGLFAANDDPNDLLGSEVNVERSTFSGNKGTEGGAAYLDMGRLEFRDCTIANNDAVFEGAGLATNQDNAVRVGGSILANDANGDNCYNKIASIGNNLDSDGTCAFQNRGDIVSSRVELGPLSDNGGPTLTMAITADSAAIDQNNPGRCAQNPTDQRGATRPVDGDGDGTKACDIGAFEYGAEIPGTATSTPTRTATGPPRTSTPRTATPTPSPTFVIDLTPTPSPTFVDGETPTPRPTNTPGGGGRVFMPYVLNKA